MAERPILFSGAMVRAILAGKKTMTRRIVKPQPVRSLPHTAKLGGVIDIHHPIGWKWRDLFVADESRSSFAENMAFHCPYGGPGDRLWVRETFALSRVFDKARPGELPIIERDVPVWYRAEDGEESWANRGRWRPSIHMPHWASRLALAVEAVRVERLQVITEEDAVAEGATCWACGGPVDGTSKSECHCYHTRSAARDSFAALWDTSNGKRAPWAENPYVWVVSFRRTP